MERSSFRTDENLAVSADSQGKPLVAGLADGGKARHDDTDSHSDAKAAFFQALHGAIVAEQFNDLSRIIGLK
jgi:hypothetical protein